MALTRTTILKIGSTQPDGISCFSIDIHMPGKICESMCIELNRLYAIDEGFNKKDAVVSFAPRLRYRYNYDIRLDIANGYMRSRSTILFEIGCSVQELLIANNLHYDQDI